jgi:hypothetical protein
MTSSRSVVVTGDGNRDRPGSTGIAWDRLGIGENWEMGRQSRDDGVSVMGFE